MLRMRRLSDLSYLRILQTIYSLTDSTLFLLPMLNTAPNFRDTTPLPIIIPPSIPTNTPIPLPKGKWLALESIEYINPITGMSETRERAVRKKAAGVVDIFPIDMADRVAMILQYRAALGTWTLESPAGLIDLPKPGMI